MWAAVLEFAAKLGSFFLKRADNPQRQYAKEVAKNEKAVLDGNAVDVNAQLELGLDSLSDKGSNNNQ